MWRPGSPANNSKPNSPGAPRPCRQGPWPATRYDEWDNDMQKTTACTPTFLALLPSSLSASSLLRYDTSDTRWHEQSIHLLTLPPGPPEPAAPAPDACEGTMVMQYSHSMPQFTHLDAAGAGRCIEVGALVGLKGSDKLFGHSTTGAPTVRRRSRYDSTAWPRDWKKVCTATTRASTESWYLMAITPKYSVIRSTLSMSLVLAAMLCKEAA